MIKGFVYNLKESFKNLWRNSIMSIASIFAVTATLLILGIIFVLILNINKEVDLLKDSFNEIVIYIKDDVKIERIKDLAEDFTRIVGIKDVKYISKEQAMQDWKEDWGENASLLDNLSENPLPNQFVLELKDLDYTKSVVEILQNDFTEFEDIKFAKDAINKMINFSLFVKKIGFVLIIALLAITTFLITNTIKMAVNARATEINIMKYIGATNWFIRWPFILEGIWIGFIGSMISSILMYLIYSKLYSYVNTQNGNLQTFLISPSLIFQEILYIFIILGIGVGSLGSLNAIRKHLNV